VQACTLKRWEPNRLERATRPPSHLAHLRRRGACHPARMRSAGKRPSLTASSSILPATSSLRLISASTKSRSCASPMAVSRGSARRRWRPAPDRSGRCQYPSPPRSRCRAVHRRRTMTALGVTTRAVGDRWRRVSLPTSATSRRKSGVKREPDAEPCPWVWLGGQAKPDPIIRADGQRAVPSRRPRSPASPV
jgi:hypothetical protein